MAAVNVIAMMVVCYCVSLVTGDVYLHNPRGSNNRLNEKTANRNTNNRVFDSQNNNKGGYNVGDATRNPARNANAQYQMRYFQSGGANEGNSYLTVEWTNQHGCGQNTKDDPIKTTCEMVLQYMCQAANSEEAANRETVLRDGTNRGRNNYNRPKDVDDNKNRNTKKKLTESKREFIRRRDRATQSNKAVNEPYMWRDKCETRERNKRLFTADQNVKKATAEATRQNPNAGRNGYECPEERDYYPYWHPTDWKDAAILVADPNRCKGRESVQKKSFNVQTYNECVEQFEQDKKGGRGESHYSYANTAQACAKRQQDTGSKTEWRTYHNFLEKLTPRPTTEQGCWTLATGVGLTRNDVVYGYAIYGTQLECLVKLDEPECKVADFSRVNHLGNGASDALKANTYEWKLPHFPSKQKQKCVFRLRYNISTTDYPPSTDSSKNGKNNSPVKQNPALPVGMTNGQTLKLAINTAQTGRTFQDRSHSFWLLKRESTMAAADIYNLNVRGKRGNIVQCYPAVEYDFAPNNLTVGKDDMVHIQWTGSNTHNNKPPGGDGQTGDDGEGKKGTDRSNIMSMYNRTKNFFTPMEHKDAMTNNMEVIWAAKEAPGNKKLDSTDLGLQLVSSGYYSCYDCGNRDSYKSRGDGRGLLNNLLNNAPASFEGVVVKFKDTKKHIYGCTRNNNFSNRSQKGEITVINGSAKTKK